MGIFMDKILRSLFLFSCAASLAFAALPPIFQEEFEGKYFSDSRVRTYLMPQKVIWKNDASAKLIENLDALLDGKNTGQASLSKMKKACVLRSTETEGASFILDFGKEIHGGIQFVSAIRKNKNPINVRVRFGESVGETMSEISAESGATNDHALRDFTLQIPWLGSVEIGNSGFRFVRIDLVEKNAELILDEINAVFIYRDIPYLGSFKCSDERLNKIWQTGAYTVHLNMQQFLWDGIKRDRLVWLGDMHPEVMTIATVFGRQDVVEKSLDFARDSTPLPKWMNGMCAYSLWWVIIHKDWYKFTGNLPYLKQQEEYLSELLKILSACVDKNTGKENLKAGGRFLDWPSTPNQAGVDAGMHALMVLTFEAAEEIFLALDNKALALECKANLELMRSYKPSANGLKQAAALLSLAGLSSIEDANKVVSLGGAKNFSTFYGYYMLLAQAKANNHAEALKNISEFWGGMLDLGATSFWEDFDLEWSKNASRIDELPQEGKVDVHATYGAYCYKKFRHSLCHGWASGPTAWLSQEVLGVKILEAGCKTVEIKPNLGNLEWASGTFPTPYGIITINHKKDKDGKITSEIKAPKEVKIKTY